MDKKISARDDVMFRNPSKENRDITFWAWNNDLPTETLLYQIDCFDKMGMGGFYMHSRIGMNVEYMSQEFLEKIKICVDEAEKRGMYACLYDEDGFPSGYAGGYVSENSEYAEKYLKFICPENLEEAERITDIFGIYDIEFDKNGYMKSYKKIGKDEEAKHLKWYAVIKSGCKTPQFNMNPYADLLNPKAVDCFIKETHEKYYKSVGKYFGNTIKNIFTDEPRWRRICTVKQPENGNFGILPWTEKFPEIILGKYNFDISEYIPELFFDFKNEYSEIRYKYYSEMSELFEESFVKKYSNWCREHNIEFTGHLDCEETLSSQMSVCGEHMPKYMYFDMPGVDVLMDERRYTTVKQAQSIVRQTGKKHILSELYGVTGWNFDFSEHKLSCDWQAALGVTTRVPHLSWVSMKKNGKRDYPASIGMQSPWYEKYNYITDHFARLSTVLTRGKPIVRVGVIHPVESMWMIYASRKTGWPMIEAYDNEFKELAETLLLNQMDFDYISEKTIPDLAEGRNVGEIRYDVIVVPQCITLRRTTVDFLGKFRLSGGKVIFAGDMPEYSDGKKDDYAKGLFENSQRVINNKGAILSSLEDYRLVEVINQYGDRDLRYIYQLREDESCRWLFLAKGIKEAHKATAERSELILRIKGSFIPVLYDTLTGEKRDLEFKTENDFTEIFLTAYNHDSFLIRLECGGRYSGKKAEDIAFKEIRLDNPDSFSLSEKNVAVLDFAEWSVNNESYKDFENIRRIECKVFDALDVPETIRSRVQPWAKTEYERDDYVRLRYTFESDIEYEGAEIALEDAERVKIIFNGEEITSPMCGYYVDMDIKKRCLTTLQKGINTLEIEFKFSKNVSFEALYLLGDFGVKAEGNNIRITEMPERLYWGDVTGQGLPFYSANIEYETEIEFKENCETELQLTSFEGACAEVYIDNKSCGLVALAPYKVSLGNVSEGKHKIKICLFGNRENTFGNLHHTGKIENGIYKWYETGDTMSYAYHLKRFGMFSEPILKIKL